MSVHSDLLPIGQLEKDNENNRKDKHDYALYDPDGRHWFESQNHIAYFNRQIHSPLHYKDSQEERPYYGETS